jgi:hypothetical protein
VVSGRALIEPALGSLVSGPAAVVRVHGLVSATHAFVDTARGSSSGARTLATSSHTLAGRVIEEGGSGSPEGVDSLPLPLPSRASVLSVQVRVESRLLQKVVVHAISARPLQRIIDG